MASSITIGGNRLYLDHNQQAEDFAQAYQEFRLRNPAPHLGESEISTAGGLGFQLLNYRDRPRLKLNQLYWPTGAMRYGECFVLADTATYAAIRETSLRQPPGTWRPLQFTATALNARTQAVTTFSTSMFVLDGIPLTAVGGRATNRLYMLHLVDPRYTWQFKQFDGDADENTTWDDIFVQLGQTLGIAVQLPEAVPAAYLNPDPVEFSKPFENAALVFDAAAASVGARVVWDTQQGVTAKVMRPSESNRLDTINLAAAWDRIAGDSVGQGGLPPAVVVTFRRLETTTPGECPSPGLYAYRATPGGLDKIHELGFQAINVNVTTAVGGAVPRSNGDHVVHSSAYADFRGGNAAPDNAAALQDLAKQIANDWYQNHAKAYDYTFQGLKSWSMTGFDDYMLLDLFSEDELAVGEERPVRRLHTRIFSQAANYGVRTQLSQDSDNPSEDECDCGDILFRNDSGEEIPPYAVMRPTGVATVNNRDVITVDQPADGTLELPHIINCGKAIADGELGHARADIVEHPILYDDAAAPAAGQQWGPTDGSWKLTRHYFGFRIDATLVNVAGPDDYVTARRVPVGPQWGVADADIAVNATGTISIHDDAVGDTGVNVDAKLGPIHGNEKVSEDKKVYIEWFSADEIWRVVNAECETP